jgi:hypothetical protein
MKNILPFIAGSALILFTISVKSQPFSKADNSVIANYPLTVEKVNEYMQFEKGFGAAKAAEPSYATLTPPHTLDERVNLLSSLPAFVKLAKSSGSNLRDITLTGASLHILFTATDPKKQAAFTKGCEMGYIQKPSAEQMAFAEAHRADLLVWQKQIQEYGKLELRSP